MNNDVERLKFRKKKMFFIEIIYFIDEKLCSIQIPCN